MIQTDRMSRKVYLHKHPQTIKNNVSYYTIIGIIAHKQSDVMCSSAVHVTVLPSEITPLIGQEGHAPSLRGGDLNGLGLAFTL